MARINSISPWIDLYKEIEVLFHFDKEIKIVYDEENNIVKLYVDNPKKAKALTLLLPPEYSFGESKLSVWVIPTNGMSEVDNDLYSAAFENNRIFSFAKTISGIYYNNITYVVFKNCVVQYFKDDLSDVYGQRSCLYEDIARSVFANSREGVFFCTDVPPPVACDGVLTIGKPLSEWP